MDKAFYKKLLFGAMILVPLIFTIVLKTSKYQAEKLPIFFGNEGVDEKGDTIYHTIAPFSFINQNGQTITQDSFYGKIYVANFFFSTCADVCPKMNKNLRWVAERMKQNPYVKFLSHTVDPEIDSVNVLHAYCNDTMNVEKLKWDFVTGRKKDLYRMAALSYRLIGMSDTAAKFAHSQQWVLIDPQGRVRGVYDGLKGYNEAKRTEDGIRALLKENYNEFNKKR